MKDSQGQCVSAAEGNGQDPRFSSSSYFLRQMMYEKAAVCRYHLFFAQGRLHALVGHRTRKKRAG